MSSQLKLTDELVLRVLSEVTIYTQFTFLAPIRDPALRLALQLQKAGCRGCAKRALRPAMAALSGAFTKLVVDEAKKTPNQLPLLRDRIKQIIGGSFDEVLISYQDKGSPAQIAF